MSGPIPTAVPPPPAPGFQSKGGRSKHASNLKKYGTPLPILLPTSPLHPASKASSSSAAAPSLLSSFSSSNSAGASRAIEVPACIGILDPASQSVWVTDPRDMATLFNRGFFGKGSLSRSEPSWRQRRVDILRGGNTLAAEQVRDKRRQERKQFKIDRAAAMLEAAKKAEAVLTTGVLPAAEDGAEAKEGDAEAEGDAVDAPAPPSPTGSTMSLATDYSSALPPGATTLNAQTFLVRPTRPDTNRNRGKRGFKRRPPPAPGSAPPAPRPPPPPVESSDSEPSDDEAALAVEEMEHLQLSFEEAWFLASALGVLKILDPVTVS